MVGGIKRRAKKMASSETLDLLSLRVDSKIAESFRDEATKRKIYQNSLFEEMWRVYVEKRNVAP